MTTVEMTIRLSVEEILHALWQLPSHNLSNSGLKCAC